METASCTESCAHWKLPWFGCRIDQNRHVFTLLYTKAKSQRSCSAFRLFLAEGGAGRKAWRWLPSKLKAAPASRVFSCFLFLDSNWSRNMSELRTLALVSSCGICSWNSCGDVCHGYRKKSHREATVTVRPNSRLNRDAEKGLWSTSEWSHWSSESKWMPMVSSSGSCSCSS